jgi:hypothetical protein
VTTKSGGAGGSQSGSNPGVDHDLVSALAGNQAERECAVAHRTRCVVIASMGVMQEQKAGRKRVISVALASILLVILCLGPLAWWVTSNLMAGGHLGELGSEISLIVGVLCPSILAAALVVGWARHRS